MDFRPHPEQGWSMLDYECAIASMSNAQLGLPYSNALTHIGGVSFVVKSSPM